MTSLRNGAVLRWTASFVVLLCLAGQSVFASDFRKSFAPSQFSILARDYFDRFYMDPEATAVENETLITADWRIALPEKAGSVTEVMAGHLADFLRERAGLGIPVVHRKPDELLETARAIILQDGNAGKVSPGSFVISVEADRVIVLGGDATVLRDGVVKLVDRMGFRQAPILAHGKETYEPRLDLRVGFKPTLGTMRDVVFMGYNGVTTGMTDFYALSISTAIPELVALQRRDYRERVLWEAAEANRLGLKSYLYVHTMHKFAEDDPIFDAHPEIRGVRTWNEDGLFTLCTEAPLVKQFLKESVQGLFRDDPGLDGLLLIIGGEGFYHCYMRPYGVEKGQTTCKRCAALGPDQTVANLCNFLADSAREVNPDAEIVVWPYSAVHVWSGDKPHTEFIKRLKPGVALLTEIEKDEIVHKPQGVEKNIWDYSIDLIGPGDRAKEQVRLAQERGIPVYLKSEPELAFEASGLPHIPCMDRWVDRADALASSGATGAWVFPAYLPHRGASTAEVYKYLWWRPVPDKEELLSQFAERLAGRKAGPYLRDAWRHVSRAIEFSPEIPPYYEGPHYFGPAHPMCADPAAELPDQFYAGYGYYAEADPEKAKIKHPIYDTDARADQPVFLEYYRKMEEHMKPAVQAIAAAQPLVDPPHRLTFDSEALSTRWLYHIVRTQVHFYESCMIRDQVLGMVHEVEEKGGQLADAEQEKARSLLARWREVLEDERVNAEEALPILEEDMRLDFRFIGFCPATEMLRAKLQLLDGELNTFLPELARKLGIAEAVSP